MAKEFYNKLVEYVSKKDTTNANALLMAELGSSLASNKTDFVDLLNSADIYANEQMSDAELITKFADNIPTNQTLMLGASYLINSRNMLSNADGEQEVSDVGVKACYKVIDDFYNADGDEYLNAGGAWAGAVTSIADLGKTVGGGIMKSQEQKKRGASAMVEKQQETKQQMTQAVLDQRRLQQEQKMKESESKAKTTKTLLIVGGSIIGLAIIGAVIYSIKKK